VSFSDGIVLDGKQCSLLVRLDPIVTQWSDEDELCESKRTVLSVIETVDGLSQLKDPERSLTSYHRS
jgi:hypothetical protein